MTRKLTAIFAVLAAFMLGGVGSGAALATPPVPLGGGSSILILKGGSSAAACTLTAIGRSKHGNRLIGITAGHCGTPGQRVYSEAMQNRGQLGEITYSTSDLDMAIIEFNSNVAPVRTVHGTTIRSVDTAPLNFPTVLCKTGRTSGKTCGVVWASDATTHYSQMCVIEGDSGAPVTLGTRLVGMVNAYYFTSCFGPETGTNIGPILQRIARTNYGGFRLI
ncbi:MAG TPA: serine protease [Gordonia sp. (in: high G+C Gram-positive bacteria)]|uniref:serine protease n=1 Tax=unclassified Gordonia (in: high G+C Gram-positive bacteria) TaxID=2657482 RepID=UPI000FA095C4|nr:MULTISPECIES: serine protease [unclassified Gordonia (in: high G+C Gram-positive bacteria)]RUP39802.1 MAG: serine protease [Gordonia sp. (in: high G+C Gram-positive bacteria)]HNP57355.1 serine protease [Gordonia sp. (in: high G+C Gram-positive bacteria)]HRC50901.1 serine protease [Gordonia sp. (in: high G+C Gram-positive bacteria)]